MKLICPNCNTRYEKGKFCPECGTPLTEVATKKILFCPVCQTELEKGKFCPECGSKLEEREIEIATVTHSHKTIDLSNPKQVPDTSSINNELPNTKSEVAEDLKASADPKIEAILAKYRDEYGDVRSLNPEEYAVAAEELQMCASKGNLEAMCFLASLYMDGHGVAKDFSKAYNLLREAESKGSKYASGIIGIFYLRGFVVEEDRNEALRRFLKGYNETQIPDLGGIIAMCYIENDEYEKALEYAQLSADKDSSIGLTALGALYQNGWGVEQNNQLAFDNYMQAAAQGNEDALNQLGWMYMNGCGVDEDPEQAFFWYNQSAQKNSDVGMFNLGFCYSEGYGVEQDYEKAAEWYKKSAEAGYEKAMLELGTYYQNILVDDDKAKMWIQKAADLGNAEAINRLGVIYLDQEENFEEAVKCFKIAIEKGNAIAYRNLAICYRDGKGVDKDLNRANELLVKASELGIDDASDINHNIVLAEEEDELEKANSFIEEGKHKEGCALFKQIADKGNAAAQRSYGRCLLEGLGTKQDLKAAVSWLEKAAKQNDSEAYLILAQAYLGTDYNGKILKVDSKKTKVYLEKAYDLGASPEDILELGQKMIPSVEISNFKADQHVKTQQGEFGVEFTFEMVVKGMIGRKLNISVYCVEDFGNKTCLKNPALAKNNPSECKYVEMCTCPYPETFWDSFHFFVAYPDILNRQADVEGTMVLMAWDQTDKRPKLLACEEIPYRISCKTHFFSSNEWVFRLLRQNSRKKLVIVPKRAKYELPIKTEAVQPTQENQQQIQKVGCNLPMDEIRRAADASYPKESLKALAVATLKIAEVIQERLPDADVSYMVHPSEFDSTCSSDALPIHFLFKKKGIPKVAVVAVTQNGYRTPRVLETAKCCKKNGITYVKVYADGTYADWIQGWSEFSPYTPDDHGPVTPETIEFCKTWLVEQITLHL